MQCAKVSGHLGQDVIYEAPINQYSQKSTRPPKFLAEDDLINTGLLKDLRHRYEDTSHAVHPGTVLPPPIPHIDNEHPRLLAEHNRVLWPNVDKWDYPYAALGDSLGEGESDIEKWFREKFGVNVPDAVVKVLSPTNRWGVIAGGGVLMAIGQMKRLRHTFANPVLSGIGGILLGLGLLPVIIEGLGEEAPKETKK